MSRTLSHAIAWMLALVLSACGGGGGSEHSEPALTLTPAALSGTTEPGEQAKLRVNARPNFTTSGTVYVMVVDSRGVIEPTVDLSAVSDGSYTATLTLSGSLAPGRYTGSLEIRVCPVSNCSQQFSGSPVQMQYDFQVGTPTNLTTLSRIAGAIDWETFQADAGHTGHVPGTFNPSSFTTRWRWAAPESPGNISSAVIANDTVYVMAEKEYHPTGGQPYFRLYALSEHDRSVRWSQDFNVFRANPPAVSGGAVYVATSGHNHTAMWSFNASSGVQRFRTPFSSQWAHYYAPTVRSGKVYNNGGGYGGLVKFDTTTGALDWFASLPQVEQWTPTVDDTFVYANLNGALRVVDLSTGTLAYSLELDANHRSYDSHTMPVQAGVGRLAMRTRPSGANTLAVVNTATRGVMWSASGTFVTDPVVAGDVLYIANDLNIEARSVATGTVLWTWHVDTVGAIANIKYNLVATDNLLFVSTVNRTYAVDLSTHATVWTYPKAGDMAISANGVLYIATKDEYGESDRALSAVNLR